MEYSGSAMEVGFNVGYLVDVLSVLGERVQITPADLNSSALLEEPGGGAVCCYADALITALGLNENGASTLSEAPFSHLATDSAFHGLTRWH